MAIALLLALTACGGSGQSVTASSTASVAPAVNSSTLANTAAVVSITTAAAVTTTTTTVSTTTTTVPVPIGRDTRLALTECGRQAGALTLGLAVGDGDTETLSAAQSACQRALDLLTVDARGVLGPTPINKMSVLVSKRMVTMAEAAIGIAARGKASDDLLNTAGKWSDDFTAAMKLLP